jgi:phenylalanyl-tRNA synthetase beta chain
MTVLGLNLEYSAVTAMLKELNFDVGNTQAAWNVVPPSYRYDVRIEEDVIEEIARKVGYDAIQPIMPVMPLSLHQSQVGGCSLQKKAKGYLTANGYSEVITYSFIDQTLQKQFGFKDEALLLSNPISAEMNAMRLSLWPGLIQTLQYNLHRSQDRARYFEAGMCFSIQASGLVQENYLSGLMYGSELPEQWAEKTRKVDFYDLKADVEHLCQGLGLTPEFRAQEIAGLHPGQSAAIFEGQTQIGCLGLLHPQIAQSLKLSGVYLFSLNMDLIGKSPKMNFKAISKFQAVSRDIAIVIKSETPAGDIERAIHSVAGQTLQALFVFDVYQGQGIPEGHKSLALRLVWQSLEATLEEQQINDLMAKVIACLNEKFAAKLRT